MGSRRGVDRALASIAAAWVVGVVAYVGVAAIVVSVQVAHVRDGGDLGGPLWFLVPLVAPALAGALAASVVRAPSWGRALAAVAPPLLLVAAAAILRGAPVGVLSPLEPLIGLAGGAVTTLVRRRTR